MGAVPAEPLKLTRSEIFAAEVVPGLEVVPALGVVPALELVPALLELGAAVPPQPAARTAHAPAAAQRDATRRCRARPSIADRDKSRDLIVIGRAGSPAGSRP